MAKPTIVFLFTIMLFLSDKALCQDDRYSLELHYDGRLAQKFGSGWILTERIYDWDNDDFRKSKLGRSSRLAFGFIDF